MKKTALGLLAAAGIAGTANADVVMYMDEVTFTSDLQDPQDIVLPAFDTDGGNNILNSVNIMYTASGGADFAGDNDDEFQGATVQARVVRSWTVAGPGGAFSFGNEDISSGFVALGADDGDGGDTGTFDPTGPDGVDFGTVGFGPDTTSQAGNVAAFAINGGGNATFTVDPLTLINTQNFQDPPGAPDAWQLEVQNPFLTIKVKVTYDFTVIPAPGATALLGLGGLAMVRRRR